MGLYELNWYKTSSKKTSNFFLMTSKTVSVYSKNASREIWQKKINYRWANSILNIETARLILIEMYKSDFSAAHFVIIEWNKKVK